ncbi:hypothetical protein L6452_35607 [Arctium lappa]|uniref:Uncharacterized protein n=1 Tax=Arctium lappa TaxID=4217 RepID=A0ACB8Y6Z7_ARCLA|nr:hypothetical protein L6452_35607 [Arctium lappa]
MTVVSNIKILLFGYVPSFRGRLVNKSHHPCLSYRKIVKEKRRWKKTEGVDGGDNREEKREEKTKEGSKNVKKNERGKKIEGVGSDTCVVAGEVGCRRRAGCRGRR